MINFNSQYPNGFDSKNCDINFHFRNEEQEAKSILNQLKKLNINYDNFLDCSLNRLYFHFFCTEMNNLQQIMPLTQKVNRFFHEITASYTLDKLKDTNTKARELFKKSIIENYLLEKSKIKKLDLCINRIESFPLLEKILSLTDLKISSIKKSANDNFKINNKFCFNETSSDLYFKLLMFKIFIRDVIAEFQVLSFTQFEEEIKKTNLRIKGLEKLKSLSLSFKSFDKLNLPIELLIGDINNIEINELFKTLINSKNFKEQLRLLDQIIKLTNEELYEGIKFFNNFNLIKKDIYSFLILNLSELDLIINNLNDGFIFYNIKKIILNLGKDNIYRKKFESIKKDYKYISNKNFNNVFNAMVSCVRFEAFDDYFQRCLDLVNDFSKDITSQDFPEFSILKADKNRSSSSKKQNVISEFDEYSLIEKTDSINPKVIVEKKDVKKSFFKEISISSVEKSLLNAIKRKKEEDSSFSIIHEFDYLFRLKEDSIYAKEANASGHFKACGLRLFIDALLKEDLEALGTIIPMLFLDLAAQTEQKSKGSTVSFEEDIAHSHSLKRLLENKGNLDQYDEKFHSYINDYNYALIWMRYLNHSNDMYKNSTSMPQSLKWAEECIQLMQDMSKKRVQLDTNLRKKLLQLVDFVFESYTQSYVILAQGREELTPLLKLWREYLGVIKNQILASLNSKKNQTIECTPLKNDHPIILLEKIIQEGKDNSLNLKEALQHLYRLEASKKLMRKYTDPVLNPWFERNLLSPWAIEALLKAMINKKGYTEHLSTHDFDALIEYFEQLNGDEPLSFKNRNSLSEFNIGIAHHYPLSLSDKMEVKQTLFKDFVDMILTAHQYVILEKKEKERNRIDTGRFDKALKLSQDVTKEIVDSYLQIN